MVISPYMQNDHVTKQEFDEFKGEMRDFKTDTEIRFDNVDHSIKELRTFVDAGFEDMQSYTNNSIMHFEERFEKKLDQKLDQKLGKTKDEIIEHINNAIKNK